MTLPSSFPLSVSQINVELGRASGAAFNMTGATERALAGILSGPISMSDFLGKSAAPTHEEGFIGFTSGDSSGSFSGVNFSTAHANRRIVVGVHWAAGGTPITISSATIGGVAATIATQAAIGGGLSSIGSAIISAAVPGGTSGNVVLTMSGVGMTISSIGVYRLVGYLSAANDTDTDSQTPNPTTLSTTVTASAGGVVFAAFSSSQTPGITFTNATERYDNSGFGGGFSTGTAAGSRNVTATQGGITNGGSTLATATWALSP